MIFIGEATNQPVEVLERLNPMRALRCEAVGTSCGHGTFRGGFGIDRSFEATGDMVLTIHGDRAEVTPFGLAGGLNGGPNMLVLNPGTAGEQELGMHSVGVEIKKGDRVLYRSNGGGGFGAPFERAPEAVARDVSDGYIDPTLAREVYGVALLERSSTYEVDEDGTRELRRAGPAAHEVGYGPEQLHPVGRNVTLETTRAPT